MIMSLHHFHKKAFYPSYSSEFLCDKNPLSKIQIILPGRLAINHSAGQFGPWFGLPHSAIM